MGAFLRYKEGPVGAYDELLAMPNVLLRDRRLSLHVPFIAVDSEASIAGGRGNWALPKTLAEFE
ncbi:MAG: acetoacetate decarboxylase family protein [Solirubrobacteraceae bacterium]